MTWCDTTDNQRWLLLLIGARTPPIASACRYRDKGLMVTRLLLLLLLLGAVQVSHSWILTSQTLSRPLLRHYHHDWKQAGQVVGDRDLLQLETGTLPLEDFSESNDNIRKGSEKHHVQDRPFTHRAPKPRPARRLNHGFKYLYRHDLPADLPSDPLVYLKRYGGYSDQQVAALKESFPPLATMSVARQLHPKMRFLKETLGVLHPHLEPTVPAEYFGARLEKILAPRHAWLVHNNLTHGVALFQTPSSSSSSPNNTTLWTEFVRAARKPHGMAKLCTQWRTMQQQRNDDTTISTLSTRKPAVTPQQIEAFDFLFGRGLMAMARNELVQHNNTWPLDHFDTNYYNNKNDNADNSLNYKPRLTAADLTRLLIQHGANPHALDHRGVSLMHWAAGAGNLPVLQVLCQQTGLTGCSTSTSTSTIQSRKTDNTNSRSTHLATLVTERDCATLLHWASAGAKAREFGCGGHVHICEYLLSQWDNPQQQQQQQRLSDNNNNITRRDYVNTQTLDGNSALHWAAWSGTLETVKLLVRYRANVDHSNRNGCTVAHWAASGGNVDVCRYLHKICGVDFSEPNYGGNTPLTHAVAFGRASVVEWLRQEVLTDDLQNDQVAVDLAQDFVGWLPTDERRKQVLQLFQDISDYGQESPKENLTTESDMAEDLVY